MGSFYLFINLCGHKLMEVQIKVIKSKFSFGKLWVEGLST